MGIQLTTTVLINTNKTN